MVPIQVLQHGVECKLYENEKPFVRYVEETPLQAAMRERKVLVNAFDLLPEKDWGFQIGRGFWIQNGNVRANSLSGIREAIFEISAEKISHEKHTCL